MNHGGVRRNTISGAGNPGIGFPSHSAFIAPTFMDTRNRLVMRALLWLLLACGGASASAQHSHINAGARSSAVGSQLFFANGAGFEAASGFLIHLTALQSPAYGPIFYGGSDVTFTSLAAFPDNGGPSAFAALPGTHVEMILETLDGPAGGALSFWDSFDGFFDATEITFTVPVGARTGTNYFALSESDGSARTDPYGHIHGRKFSADVPGLYVAGFRLVDTGQNGPGSGPLHAPSNLAYFNLQAGVTIADLSLSGDGVRVRFGTETDRSYFVETTATLGAAPQWKTVAGPIAGTGRMATTEGIAVANATAYFRLRVE